MKKIKTGKVYVVICIDAEGPISDKKKPEIINNWSTTKELIKKITKKKYRNLFLDSAGKGLIYSWFILTLTGFKKNPFKRPLKYHQTFDFYTKNFNKNFKKFGDEIYWHYHQPSKSKIANVWCKDWSVSQEYFNILNRLVCDKKFFPSCFRAGGRIEDDDLSNWIEEFIPFDYSNCSGDINWQRIESDGKKLIEVCDWSKSPTAWKGYHPSKENYQSHGDQKRYVFRTLDLKSPVYSIKDNDIKEAFQLAESGSDAVLSIFEHDRRFNVVDNISFFCNKVLKIKKLFPKVDWFYSNAKDAAVKSTKQNINNAPKFFIKKTDEARITISTNDNIFGSRPYVCLKDKNNDYFEVPLNIIGLNKWVTPSLKIFKNFILSVVANNISGNSKVYQKHIKFK